MSQTQPWRRAVALCKWKETFPPGLLFVQGGRAGGRAGRMPPLAFHGYRGFLFTRLSILQLHHFPLPQP